MEKLIIKNFGGINESSIDINDINILIGKSASGKSVTIKLIYYFKNIFRDFFDFAQDGLTKVEVNKKLLSTFEDYFPLEVWKDCIFDIKYYYDENEYAIINKSSIKGKINIEYSKRVYKQYSNAKRLVTNDKSKFESKDKFEIYRPDHKIFEKYLELLKSELNTSCANFQILIPAGRSFFATLQSSIFSFLSNNKAIDPFLIKFGSFYENIKSIASRESFKNNDPREKYIDEIIIEILGGKYTRIKSRDYIVHEDKRQINLAYASSGQQETLPLALILKVLTRISFIGEGITLYIEEPEAHLFPEAQRKIVELISAVFKLSKCKTQIIITTHSPYIISSFNNNLEAGHLEAEMIDKDNLYQIINKWAIIPKGSLNAFSVENNSFKNIIDDDYDLINSEYLDAISKLISNEFSNLLDLEN